MWKRLLILALMLAPVAFIATPLLALPFAELAESPRIWGVTTQDVLVTATPEASGLGPPSGLIATYVNDYQVHLEWNNHPLATSVLVRAKYGEYPADRFDGYEVYLGAAESFEDTAVNFYEYLGQVYYAAWSTNVTDWSPTYAEASLEGPAVSDLVAQIAILVSYIPDFVQLVVFVIVAGIIGLVFWKESLFLYALAVPVCMVYGFTLADEEANGSPLWVGGIIIAVIGMYCLFKVATMGLGEIKARKK